MMATKPLVNWDEVTKSVMAAARLHGKRFIKVRYVTDIFAENPDLLCNELLDVSGKSYITRINTVLLREFPLYRKGGNGGAVYICEWVKA